MNNLNTRHAGTAAGAGLVAAVAVEAVLPFLSRAIHAGPAVLLAPAIVIFLDIRWRLGVGPELRRAAFRESRCTWLRSGACQNKPSEVERWLNSIGKRVKRAERRVLCSLKLGNLQMRDRRIDHDDLVAAAEDLLEAPAGLRATFPLPIYLPERTHSDD